MRIAYFCLGSGSGNLMIGASIFNALVRIGEQTEFTAITDSEFTPIFSKWFNIIQIKGEPEKLFTDDLNTELYRALKSVNPDLIIVFMMWMPIMPLLEGFSCPKVLLIRQCPQKWLIMKTAPEDSIDVNFADYSAAFSIEPGFQPHGFAPLPPLILKNRDELPSPEASRAKLGLIAGEKLCIAADNGPEDEYRDIIEKSKALCPFDCTLITATNKGGGENSLFPLIDYLPAVDFVVGSAGYNLFYECRYLNIPARFFAYERKAEDQMWRIETNGHYHFHTNGADILAGRLLNLLYNRENLRNRKYLKI
ncbi:MAG: hypothetical protein JEZ04_07340 [Spirochaetales bacterium]|nr:hypothetical protein [Spirochaetales bacterium]